MTEYKEETNEKINSLTESIEANERACFSVSMKKDLIEELSGHFGTKQ